MVNLPTPQHARWCPNQNTEPHVCRVVLGTVGPVTVSLARYASLPPLMMLFAGNRVLGDMTVSEVRAFAELIDRAAELLDGSDDDRTDM